MSSILVLEQEPRYIERIHTALGAEGWRVRTVHEPAQALQAAAAETPDLVIVSAAVSGVEAVARSLSRSAGGPGVLGLLPEPPQAGGALQADEVLAKPFTDQDLQTVVRRAVLARRPQGPPAAAAVAAEAKLTSLDIFGDVLAEVEGLPKTPPAAAPASRPAPAPAPAAAKAAPPPSDEDINRRLEKTLSGVFGPDLKRAPSAPARPAAPAQPPARKPERAEAGLNDIDAILSRTLSNLDLGSKPKPAAAPPAAPPAAPARPAAAAPPAAPVQESTAARKPAKTLELDLSALEELARPRRPAPPREVPRESAPGGLSVAPPAPPAQSPRPETPPASPLAAVTAPVVIPDLPDLLEPPVVEMTAPEPPTTVEELEEPPVPLAVEPPAEPVAAAPPDLPAPPPPAPEPVPVAEPARALQDFAATQRIPVMTAEDEGGERFGQYTLLEKVAAGGMAEVWKARMRGVEGFQKTVAIKRILPHMTDNSEFVGMFIDEAKLAAQLNHPNIVHIYDLGKIGRDYYIAMEYVEGMDLRSLLNAGRRTGRPLPLGLALLIGARLASALDYAHRKRDFEGRELGLVHRDVSPQNVLISHEGDVKLCDFGIAKAVSQAGQTQMGALKGKLQYMSPEQAWGRPVDARSDIFSLGAVLFEMVTGDRLFSGDSEMSVLESVRQGRIRSAREVDPAVPPAVEAIVAQALAHEPQNRFQSAGEMAQRIGAVLRDLVPAPSPADLASYLQRVAAPEPEAAPAEEISHFLPEPSSYTPPPAEPPPPAPAAEEAPAVEAVAPVGEVRVEESAPRSRRLLYAAIAALVVAVLLTLFLLNRPRGERPAPPVQAGPQAPAAGPGPAPQAPAAAAPSAAPGAAVDIAGLVSQEMARKEEEQQKKYEEQVAQLEKQLAAAKKSGQEATAPVPAAVEAPRVAAPPEPAPAATPVPEPPPAVAEAAPAVQAQEPPQPEPAPQEQPAAAAPTPAPEPEAPRVRPGDLVSMGPGVTPPELVSVPKAQYPPLARRMQAEGVVVVSVLVDESGQVRDARVVESTHPKMGFNESALNAARGARYRPATKNGVRVKIWTRLRIPFKL